MDWGSNLVDAARQYNKILENELINLSHLMYYCEEPSIGRPLGPLTYQYN